MLHVPLETQTTRRDRERAPRPSQRSRIAGGRATRPASKEKSRWVDPAEEAMSHNPNLSPPLHWDD